MIDPISAFAAVKTAHSVIMQGIKVGKDLSSLSGYISKWAIGEANIEVKAEKKGRSLFGKFSSVEAQAIQAHLRNYFKGTNSYSGSRISSNNPC